MSIKNIICLAFLCVVAAVMIFGINDSYHLVEHVVNKVESKTSSMIPLETRLDMYEENLEKGDSQDLSALNKELAKARINERRQISKISSIKVKIKYIIKSIETLKYSLDSNTDKLHFGRYTTQEVQADILTKTNSLKVLETKLKAEQAQLNTYRRAQNDLEEKRTNYSVRSMEQGAKLADLRQRISALNVNSDIQKSFSIDDSRLSYVTSGLSDIEEQVLENEELSDIESQSNVSIGIDLDTVKPTVYNTNMVNVVLESAKSLVE